MNKFFLIFLLIPIGVALAEPYEDSVRAATKRLNGANNACRLSPGVPGPAMTLCTVQADAEWVKAMALADAARIGTKAGWQEAEIEINKADARVARARALLPK